MKVCVFFLLFLNCHYFLIIKKTFSVSCRFLIWAFYLHMIKIYLQDVELYWKKLRFYRILTHMQGLISERGSVFLPLKVCHTPWNVFTSKNKLQLTEGVVSYDSIRRSSFNSQMDIVWAHAEGVCLFLVYLNVVFTVSFLRDVKIYFLFLKSMRCLFKNRTSVEKWLIFCSICTIILFVALVIQCLVEAFWFHMCWYPQGLNSWNLIKNFVRSLSKERLYRVGATEDVKRCLLDRPTLSVVLGWAGSG